MSPRERIIEVFRRAGARIELSVPTIALLIGATADRADEAVAELRRCGTLEIGRYGGIAPAAGFVYETDDERRARREAEKAARKARRAADRARSDAARAERIKAERAERAARQTRCACGAELKWGGTMCRPCYRKRAAERTTAIELRPRRCRCGKNLVGGRKICATCEVASTCGCGKMIKTAGKTMCANCAQKARHEREAADPARIAAREARRREIEARSRCACGAYKYPQSAMCRACFLKSVSPSPKPEPAPGPPAPRRTGTIVVKGIEAVDVRTYDPIVHRAAPRPPGPAPAARDPWAIIRERTYGKPPLVGGSAIKEPTKEQKMSSGRRVMVSS